MRSIVKLARRVGWWRHWRIDRFVLEGTLRPDVNIELADLAGWLVPTQFLDASSVCYCAGVGENIDFERALQASGNCTVVSMDPTPRSITYIERTAADVPKFLFLPVGLWSRDETLKFYAPENAKHVSHTVVGRSQGTGFFDAECRRISTIMKDLGHDRIDVLKMNIEGAEYEALGDMIESNLRPRCIAFAVEGETPLRSAYEWTRRLRGYGYGLAAVHRWVLTFVDRRQNESELRVGGVAT